MTWGKPLKYKIKFTSRFKKDLKQAKKQGKDIEKLFDVIEKTVKDEVEITVTFKAIDLVVSILED